MASFEPSIASTRAEALSAVRSKMLRNTYSLLSLTLLFSALTAWISTMLMMPPMTYLICIGGAMLLS